MTAITPKCNTKHGFFLFVLLWRTRQKICEIKAWIGNSPIVAKQRVLQQETRREREQKCSRMEACHGKNLQEEDTSPKTYDAHAEPFCCSADWRGSGCWLSRLQYSIWCNLLEHSPGATGCTWLVQGYSLLGEKLVGWLDPESGGERIHIQLAAGH